MTEVSYREVVQRGSPPSGSSRQALASPGGGNAAAFPLLVRPALVDLVRSGPFGRFEALDVEALVRAQLDVLLGPSSPGG